MLAARLQPRSRQRSDANRHTHSILPSSTSLFEDAAAPTLPSSRAAQPWPGPQGRRILLRRGRRCQREFCDPVRRRLSSGRSRDIPRRRRSTASAPKPRIGRCRARVRKCGSTRATTAVAPPRTTLAIAFLTTVKPSLFKSAALPCLAPPLALLIAGEDSIALSALCRVAWPGRSQALVQAVACKLASTSASEDLHSPIRRPSILSNLPQSSREYRGRLAGVG